MKNKIPILFLLLASLVTTTLGTPNSCIPSPCPHNEACFEGPPIECICNDGYTRDMSETCKPIPCGGPCGVDESCVSEFGNFICECNFGFTGSPTNDIPCTAIPCGGPCGVDESCVSEFGNFICECNFGFTGSPTNDIPCTELIDECLDGTHDCDENAQCTDTDDGFTCTCDEGYTGDGTDCKLIEELNCKNLKGHYDDTNDACYFVLKRKRCFIKFAREECAKRNGTIWNPRDIHDVRDILEWFPQISACRSYVEPKHGFNAVSFPREHYSRVWGKKKCRKEKRKLNVVCCLSDFSDHYTDYGYDTISSALVDDHSHPHH